MRTGDTVKVIKTKGFKGMKPFKQSKYVGAIGVLTDWYWDVGMYMVKLPIGENGLPHRYRLFCEYELLLIGTTDDLEIL